MGYPMSAVGKVFYWGDFLDSVVTGVRTLMGTTILNRPNEEIILTNFHTNTQGSGVSVQGDTIEIIMNGATIHRETLQQSPTAIHWTLPFTRLEAIGTLEFFLTRTGPNDVACSFSLKGFYVPRGKFPFRT